MRNRFSVELSGYPVDDSKREGLEGSVGDDSRLEFDGGSSAIVVPSDAKVSCKYGDACTSPSRRDQTKPKAWMCGSDHSHDDRLGGCAVYCRFENYLKHGESGNRRFPKQ